MADEMDAVTARQFERREPNPAAAQWEPGELNECVCGECHTTSVFGGVRVITDPNLPHGHPGVVVRFEDTAYDDVRSRLEAVEAENRQLRQRMESLAREIEGERIDYTADVDLGYNDGLEVAAELVRLTVASGVTADV